MVKSNQTIKITKLNIIISFLLIFNGNTLAYADNMDWFNKGNELAKQHQFNMGLNANSNINSFTKEKYLSTKIADGANTGASDSKNMYGGQKNDPNYLYNHGKQAIQDCENQQDPRCSTLNKYADKNTQTQLQSYMSGISTRYQMTVAPDPTNKDCAIIKRKKPINETIEICTSTQEQHTTHTQCNNIITPNQVATPQTPADGIVFNPILNAMCDVTNVTGVIPFAESPQYLFDFGTTLFVIKSNMGSFLGGSLPMLMRHSNGNWCGSIDNTIITTPTSTPRQLAHFTDASNSPLDFYQDPSQNCGVDSTTQTCSIKIRLMSEKNIWEVVDNLVRAWVVIFPRPVPASATDNYIYTKGCP